MTDKSVTRVLAVVLAVLAVGAVAVTGVAIADQAETDDSDDLDAQQSSYLRVIHATPDAPAVDVTVDNDTVLTDVEYGAVSEYLRLPAGNHSVTITAADDSDQVLYEGAVFFEARTASTMAAAGAPTQDGAITEEGPTEDATTPGENETTPAADEAIGENETTPAADEAIGENETTPAADEAIGENETTPVDDGTMGENETDGAQAQLQPVMFIDNAWDPTNESAAVSAINLAPDAPAVDVTVPADQMADGNATMGDTATVDENDTVAGNETGQESIVVADDLTYRRASDYVTVPAGEVTFQIRAESPDNDGEILETVNATLEGGTAHSALALANVTENATAGDDATMGENETPGDDVTVGENETMGDNATAEADATDGENDTAADNETVGENDTLAGNETTENQTGGVDENATDGAGPGASIMVSLTDDVTYAIQIPGEDVPADDGNDTADGVDETPTETPDDGMDTPDADDGTATPIPVGDNETTANGNETVGTDNETIGADNDTVGADNDTVGADNDTVGADDETEAVGS